jgi:peroxiredoxin
MLSATSRAAFLPAILLTGSLAASSAAAIPQVGDKAPDFTLSQIDGRKLTLSANRSYFRLRIEYK